MPHYERLLLPVQDAAIRQYPSKFSFPVIIVTGGQHGSIKIRSAEILKADGSPICGLPDLPEARGYHSQSGLVACGGMNRRLGDISKSCVTFEKGVWTKTNNLGKDWYFHASWFSSRHGTILMGGSHGFTNKAAEKLSKNGKSSPSFKLKYGLK